TDDDTQRCASLEFDRMMIPQLARADLRAAQILHYGNGTARLFRRRADARDRGAMRLVRAVREVQTEDVRAAGDQRPNHFVPVARGPDSRHQLGMTHDA